MGFGIGCGFSLSMALPRRRRSRRRIGGGHDGPDAARRLHDRGGLAGRARRDPRPHGRLRRRAVGARRHRDGGRRPRRDALAGLAAPRPGRLGRARRSPCDGNRGRSGSTLGRRGARTGRARGAAPDPVLRGGARRARGRARHAAARRRLRRRARARPRRAAGRDRHGPRRLGRLLEIARERLPEADLRQGDLEALPYADDSFDAVTAFNSVQYAGDPAAALREIRRVARPARASPSRPGAGPSSARCEPS